ncbi:hypothetical protein QQA43_31475 (plasmid) [Mycolicibacterium vanbaalenii]|uniref:hypothetical protein n=1 Tax=Mycolicibacterium vanbaalenii TaxID=110539 RepID=UPI002877FBE8|nr:hypothetical protein [Mycolicibacterium vanbaalenii]MDZ4232510.1 hypothetical protein [Dietzia sp.]WND60391.1 hypothetical protein QQA43_31475 [Mycolicibacterium vanbaalenii]
MVLAASALVVALTTRANSGGLNSAAAPAGDPAASSSAASTEHADRALCTAIAPLMTEYDKTSSAWIGLGDPGTPARDAALPKFKADTEEWVGRVEAVMQEHPGVQPRLTRTLERHIDDLWLLVNNIEPGPERTYDKAAWTDSMIAYGGPLAICYDVGIRW